MKIKSTKYPNIEYNRNEEIFLMPEDELTPFIFDVTEDLTTDDDKMNLICEIYVGTMIRKSF